MKISLIGLGAIGASYAERLNNTAEIDLTIILDDTRLKTYTEQDFTINGKPQVFKYLSANADTDPADLIIVAVKYNALNESLDAIKHHVGDNTVIMSLLNGIDSEEIIGSRYGMDKMLYSLCIGIDAQRVGRDVHYGNIGKIVFGEKNGALSPRVTRIADAFSKAGIPFETPNDMYRQLWYKFMINVCANQPTAILGASYNHIDTPDGHEIMHMIAKEVTSIAIMKGVRLTEDDFKAWLNILNSLDPKSKTSMLQDMDAGRPTEVEMLSGVIRKLGKEYGIPTPYNDMLYHMIKVKEKIMRFEIESEK